MNIIEKQKISEALMKIKNKNKRKKIAKLINKPLVDHCTWGINNTDVKNEKQLRWEMRRKLRSKLLKRFRFTKHNWKEIEEKKLNPNDYVCNKNKLVLKSECAHYQLLSSDEYIDKMFKKYYKKGGILEIPKRENKPYIESCKNSQMLGLSRTKYKQLVKTGANIQEMVENASKQVQTSRISNRKLIRTITTIPEIIDNKATAKTGFKLD